MKFRGTCYKLVGMTFYVEVEADSAEEAEDLIKTGDWDDCYSTEWDDVGTGTTYDVTDVTLPEEE